MQAKRAVSRLLTLLPTLLLGALLLLPSELPLALPTVAALAVHELGHVLAFSLLGEPAPALGFALGGLRLSAERPLSHRAEGLIAAAGPLSNLLFAGAFLLLSRFSGGASEYLVVCAILQLSAGLWNLLPIGDLDGGRIVSALLSPLPPDLAEALSCLVSHLVLLLSLTVSLGILHFSGACFYTSLALLLLSFTEL